MEIDKKIVEEIDKYMTKYQDEIVENPSSIPKVWMKEMEESIKKNWYVVKIIAHLKLRVPGIEKKKKLKLFVRNKVQQWLKKNKPKKEKKDKAIKDELKEILISLLMENKDNLKGLKWKGFILKNIKEKKPDIDIEKYDGFLQEEYRKWKAEMKKKKEKSKHEISPVSISPKLGNVASVTNVSEKNPLEEYTSNEKKTDLSDPKFKEIKKLVLKNNTNITDDDLKYLKGIQTLYLNSNINITDEGLKHLEGIQTLYLNSNKKITDEGLKHLKGIDTLYLFNNKNITDEGLKYLKGAKKVFINKVNVTNKINDLKEGLSEYDEKIYVNFMRKSVKDLKFETDDLTKDVIIPIENLLKDFIHHVIVYRYFLGNSGNGTVHGNKALDFLLLKNGDFKSCEFELSTAMPFETADSIARVLNQNTHWSDRVIIRNILDLSDKFSGFFDISEMPYSFKSYKSDVDGISSEIYQVVLNIQVGRYENNKLKTYDNFKVNGVVTDKIEIVIAELYNHGKYPKTNIVKYLYIPSDMDKLIELADISIKKYSKSRPDKVEKLKESIQVFESIKNKSVDILKNNMDCGLLNKLKRSNIKCDVVVGEGTWNDYVSSSNNYDNREDMKEMQKFTLTHYQKFGGGKTEKGEYLRQWLNDSRRYNFTDHLKYYHDNKKISQKARILQELIKESPTLKQDTVLYRLCSFYSIKKDKILQISNLSSGDLLYIPTFSSTSYDPYTMYYSNSYVFAPPYSMCCIFVINVPAETKGLVSHKLLGNETELLLPYNNFWYVKSKKIRYHKNQGDTYPFITYEVDYYADDVRKVPDDLKPPDNEMEVLVDRIKSLTYKYFLLTMNAKLKDIMKELDDLLSEYKLIENNDKYISLINQYIGQIEKTMSGYTRVKVKNILETIKNNATPGTCIVCTELIAKVKEGLNKTTAVYGKENKKIESMKVIKDAYEFIKHASENPYNQCKNLSDFPDDVLKKLEEFKKDFHDHTELNAYKNKIQEILKQKEKNYDITKIDIDIDENLINTAISKKNRYFAINTTDNIYIYDHENPKDIKIIKSKPGYVYFSNEVCDKPMLLSSNGSEITIYNMYGENIKHFKIKCYSVCFSIDDKHLMIGHENEVSKVDIESGEIISYPIKGDIIRIVPTGNIDGSIMYVKELDDEYYLGTMLNGQVLIENKISYMPSDIINTNLLKVMYDIDNLSVYNNINNEYISPDKELLKEPYKGINDVDILDNLLVMVDNKGLNLLKVGDKIVKYYQIQSNSSRIEYAKFLNKDEIIFVTSDNTVSILKLPELKWEETFDLNEAKYHNKNDIFIEAIKDNNIKKAEFWLTKGNADINSKDTSDGKSALFIAIDNNNEKMIDMLLTHNADKNKMYNSKIAYDYAKEKGMSEEILDKLKIPKEYKLFMAFQEIAYGKDEIKNKEKIVKLIDEGDIDLDYAYNNDNGNRYLVFVTPVIPDDFDFNIFKKLLEKGANPNFIYRKGKTYSLISYLVINNNTQYLEELLKHDQTIVDFPDKRGDTAFMWAIFKGYMSMANLLLSKGANINHVGGEGTALMENLKNSERVKYLLEKGADKTVVHKGKTALDMAKEKGYQDSVKLLENFDKEETIKDKIESELKKFITKDNYKEINTKVVKKHLIEKFGKQVIKENKDFFNEKSKEITAEFKYAIWNYNDFIIDKDVTTPSGHKKFKGFSEKYKATKDGKEYLLKKGYSKAFTFNEVMVSHLYKLFGLNVPNLYIVERSIDDYWIASEILPHYKDCNFWEENNTMCQDLLENAEKFNGLLESFFVSAVFRNWDCIGRRYDNVGCFDKDCKEIVHIDLGGTLMFKGAGNYKANNLSDSFDVESIDEDIKGLLDVNKNINTALVYSQLIYNEIKFFNAISLIKNVKREDIKRIVNKYAKYHTGEMLNYYNTYDKLVNIIMDRIEKCKKYTFEIFNLQFSANTFTLNKYIKHMFDPSKTLQENIDFLSQKVQTNLQFKKEYIQDVIKKANISDSDSDDSEISGGAVVPKMISLDLSKNPIQTPSVRVPKKLQSINLDLTQPTEVHAFKHLPEYIEPIGDSFKEKEEEEEEQVRRMEHHELVDGFNSLTNYDYTEQYIENVRSIIDSLKNNNNNLKEKLEDYSTTITYQFRGVYL